ncbi:MAG: glycosyltransferase family 39 protein [Deltaproteobacteria bacterium]|nr:glycosyltransferase family 39 protein [Deltaproteobacteria bacterium]
MFPAVSGFFHRFSSLALAATLFVLSFGAFLWRLGEGPIYRTMEGREALVMQEMMRSGNWVLPLRNGETIPSKPPFLHWLGVGVSALSGGVSEWSARFPNALFSALSVALTFWLGCRLSGREVGLLAALMLLTTPCFLEMSREAWVDPALAFFVLAAIASFASMYEDEEWRGWRSAAFYVSLACATLSKGPVGMILPLLVIVAYLAVQQQLSRLWSLWSWRGAAFALGVPLLWYGLAFAQEGWAFVQKQVLQENLVRFAAGSGKRIPSSVFFVMPFLVEGFPWSLLFGVGLWNFSRHAPVREKGVLPLLWLFAVAMFFSVSAGKRNVYLLPVYPAMALFAAEWGWPWVAGQTRPLPAWLQVLVRLVSLLLGGLVLWVALQGAFGGISLEAPWIERLLGDAKWENLVPHLRLLSEHPAYAVTLYGVLVGGGVWTVFVASAGRWRAALWGLLLLAVVGALGQYPFTRAYLKEFKTFTGFAVAIQRIIGPHDAFWFYTPEPYSSEFDEFSQVYFYLNRQVRLAPCAQQADLSQCQPGFYLLRERHWQKLRATSQARLVLDSQDSAGPDPETRLVVIRLGE